MAEESSGKEPETPPKPLPATFCETIPEEDITIIRKIGHGAYGVVMEGMWRNKRVAIKLIEHTTDDNERQAFVDEMTSLSRVKHENIIQLYGALVEEKKGGLVMEFAEDGSLYELIHGSKRTRYTADHAVSWVLQCARGVQHLHSLHLVHRDLKPPNLLLQDAGRRLKICDFGTVCDLKTYMTNNKGSAAWMAPEVFEGVKYTDRCDVFSWAIILWEVLTRRRPFEEVGGGAFRIMWAVHSGTRPPLIRGCPKALEIIMTQAWDKEPRARPSMHEIVQRMTTIAQFFEKQNEPIDFNLVDKDWDDGVALSEGPEAELTMSESETLGTLEGTYDTSTLADLETDEGDPVPLLPLPEPRLRHVIEDEPPTTSQSRSMSSLRPGILTQSASLSNLATDVPTSKAPAATAAVSTPWVRGHNRTGSHPLNTLKLDQPPETHHKKTSVPAGPLERPGRLAIPVRQRLANPYASIDPYLQPLNPDPTSEESLQIYDEHCKLADEYITMKEEIELLQRAKGSLIVGFENSLRGEEGASPSLHEEYDQLLRERDKLLRFKQELTLQLAKLQPR